MRSSAFCAHQGRNVGKSAKSGKSGVGGRGEDSMGSSSNAVRRSLSSMGLQKRVNSDEDLDTRDEVRGVT